MVGIGAVGQHWNPGIGITLLIGWMLVSIAGIGSCLYVTARVSRPLVVAWFLNLSPIPVFLLLSLGLLGRC